MTFDIVRFSDDGSIEVLEVFDNYDDADDRIDYWVNRYPYAWIDITDPNDNN